MRFLVSVSRRSSLSPSQSRPSDRRDVAVARFVEFVEGKDGKDGTEGKDGKF